MLSPCWAMASWHFLMSGSVARCLAGHRGGGQSEIPLESWAPGRLLASPDDTLRLLVTPGPRPLPFPLGNERVPVVEIPVVFDNLPILSLSLVNKNPPFLASISYLARSTSFLLFSQLSKLRDTHLPKHSTCP